jgi:hypothetical protein
MTQQGQSPPKLPEPECSLGYSGTQLQSFLGVMFTDFCHWMRGQTVSLCDGKFYDHTLKQEIDSNCGPHGVVVYADDVLRYLQGKPVID